MNECVRLGPLSPSAPLIGLSTGGVPLHLPGAYTGGAESGIDLKGPTRVH